MNFEKCTSFVNEDHFNLSEVYNVHPGQISEISEVLAKHIGDNENTYHDANGNHGPGHTDLYHSQPHPSNDTDVVTILEDSEGANETMDYIPN